MTFKTSSIVLLLVLYVGFFPTITAQVGINTATPAPGSMLDIHTTDKGMLIPRVNIANLNTIAPITGGATESLLVYNTNATTGKGFYYWDGSIWKTLDPGWKLEGNANTDPGVTANKHFLGTTDETDLVVATDGIERARFFKNGQLSINTNDIETYEQVKIAGSLGNNALTAKADGFGSGLAGIATESGYGIYAENSGDYYALGVISEGTGDGIYNLSFNGNIGMFNEMISNSTAIYTDLTSAGGIGEYIDFDAQNGDGVLVKKVDDITLPSIGGDGIGFASYVNTVTPPVGINIEGAAFAGNQHGVGHGMLLNHYGASGRTAEYNSLSPLNSSPALFVSKNGIGNTLYVESSATGLAANMQVGSFTYTGGDSQDHVALLATSAPATSWGIGVQGVGGYFGVYGEHTGGSGFGVFSSGDTGATGTKSFIIDHPQDPANKFLKHFSIESDEVLNMYRGMATFDAAGRAVITMPSYYSLVNKDASYQLTPVGAAMPQLFIEKELDGDTFIIAGGIEGKKVSWTVTAQRNDPYLQQNPEKRNVIVDKGERSGKYLTPQLYGQPESKKMHFVTNKTETKSYQISGEKYNDITPTKGRGISQENSEKK